ncbi:MAG: multiheme c-type cytochrome, partial [Planctomycetota bacterium]
TMTQVPTHESVIANFDNHIVKYGGVNFRFFQENDAFFMEIDDQRQNEAQRVDRQTYKMVLSTGAHHQQAFWCETDQARTLRKVPFIWITAENRWIPYNAIFLAPPTGISMQAGVWNKSCIKCHVVGGQPRLDAESGYDSHVAEFGISCEACHGPAELHASGHRNPLSRYSEHFSAADDPTLVNPIDLSHERSSQTCGQCHSVFEPIGDELNGFNNGGYTYRPGDDLNDSRHVFQCGHNDDHPTVKQKLASNPKFFEHQFWSDGKIRITGREFNGLLETPCYQHGMMSCMSCHEMHQKIDDPRSSQEWAEDQLKPGMRGNQACIQCHTEYESEDQLALHTHHAPTSSGSQCYNCHMPHTTLGLMKASRSHTVYNPDVAATLETGRPNACNLCHLDKTLAWTSDYLEAWYSIPPPELSDEDRKVASSVRWLLTGDAGQRAIVGWHFGWRPAQEISGTLWMAPYLAELLTDSYEVVRFIGFHSLKELPNFADFEYDFVGSTQSRTEARRRALDNWDRQSERPSASEALLLDDRGMLRKGEYQRMRDRRSDPHFVLTE